MGDDLRRLADLLHRVAQLTDRPLVVRRAELDEVDRVAHEQAGVVEGVVELVGDARRELAERGEFRRLDELLLFLTQLLLASLHLDRRLPQVPHDMNGGFAAGFETQLVLVRVLQEVQQRPTGVVEPLSLAGQSSAVLLVIRQDMQHGLALVGEALVELVQVAHDVEHRAALRVASQQPALEHLHVRPESGLGHRGLLHRDQILPALSLSTSLRKLSSSFSRAIIFSSRPTTTSSNFSRSKIFSCSSPLDFSRSRTTCAYSRISRKTPMAPITLPSGSRSAEALRVVGITSPLALRGLRRALRVTPRSTTSPSAAVNS